MDYDDDFPRARRRKTDMYPKSDPMRHALAPALIATLAIVAFVAMATYQLTRTQPMSRRPPTVQPTAAARPTDVQSATAAPAVPQQDAYNEPDGTLMGTIPQTVTLDYQDSTRPHWAGVDWDGGIVWVRADPPEGALDLARPPQPPPRAVAPPPPLPTPHCVTVSALGQSAEACGYDDAALAAEANSKLEQLIGATHPELAPTFSPVPDNPTYTPVSVQQVR